MEQETKNRVLLSLSEAVREEILKECERVELEGGTTLRQAGETTTSVYFPETAVISILATYRNGSTIEMANVGRESFTGINLALGLAQQLNTDDVQIGGTALEMPAKAFTKLMSKQPEFEKALFSAVQASVYQIMVSGACNGTHEAKQRLARWLLTMDARNDDETMYLTQDFLAQMLGLRRATVSDAASDLQDNGIIEYSRGKIRIVDHAGLRAASCECFDLVREAHEALLPYKTKVD